MKHLLVARRREQRYRTKTLRGIRKIRCRTKRPLQLLQHARQPLPASCHRIAPVRSIFSRHNPRFSALTSHYAWPTSTFTSRFNRLHRDPSIFTRVRDVLRNIHTSLSDLLLLEQKYLHAFARSIESPSKDNDSVHLTFTITIGSPKVSLHMQLWS